MFLRTFYENTDIQKRKIPTYRNFVVEKKQGEDDNPGMQQCNR